MMVLGSFDHTRTSVTEHCAGVSSLCGRGLGGSGAGDAVESQVDPGLIVVNALGAKIDVFDGRQLLRSGDFDECVLCAGRAAPAKLGTEASEQDDLRLPFVAAAGEITDVDVADLIGPIDVTKEGEPFPDPPARSGPGQT